MFSSLSDPLRRSMGLSSLVSCLIDLWFIWFAAALPLLHQHVLIFSLHLRHSAKGHSSSSVGGWNCGSSLGSCSGVGAMAAAAACFLFLRSACTARHVARHQSETAAPEIITPLCLDVLVGRTSVCELISASFGCQLPQRCHCCSSMFSSLSDPLRRSMGLSSLVSCLIDFCLVWFAAALPLLHQHVLIFSLHLRRSKGHSSSSVGGWNCGSSVGSCSGVGAMAAAAACFLFLRPACIARHVARCQ
jgi:hypothetical protein